MSNATPPTLLVTLDAVLSERLDVSKRMRTKLGRRIRAEAILDLLDRAMLSRIWQMTNRAGWRADLVVFGRDDDFATDLLFQLDERGMHAFAWVLSEDSPEALAKDLPWRTHVAAILDIPERSLLWGSRGVDVGWVF